MSFELIAAPGTGGNAQPNANGNKFSRKNPSVRLRDLKDVGLEKEQEIAEAVGSLLDLSKPAPNVTEEAARKAIIPKSIWGSSGYVGVSWDKNSKKWRAHSRDSTGNRVELKRHSTEKKAAEAIKRYNEEGTIPPRKTREKVQNAANDLITSMQNINLGEL